LSEAQVRTPKPVPEPRELRSAPLTPTDGYVLSRVDGTVNERDLAASTGLKEEHVQASLAKLEALGLIMYDVGPSSASILSSTPATTRVSSVERRAAAQPLPSAFSPSPPPVPLPGNGSAPHDDQVAGAMAEAVDLDPELRLRVIATHRNIDQVDHYALLGVERSADKKAIKRAYYDPRGAVSPRSLLPQEPWLLQDEDEGHLRTGHGGARRAHGQGGASRVRRLPRGAAPVARDRGAPGGRVDRGQAS